MQFFHHKNHEQFRYRKIPKHHMDTLPRAMPSESKSKRRAGGKVMAPCPRWLLDSLTSKVVVLGTQERLENCVCRAINLSKLRRPFKFGWIHRKTAVTKVRSSHEFNMNFFSTQLHLHRMLSAPYQVFIPFSLPCPRAFLIGQAVCSNVFLSSLQNAIRFCFCPLKIFLVPSFDFWMWSSPL